MTNFFRIEVINEATARFSRLLAEVEAGGEVVVARHKKPVARILPAAKASVPRISGLAGRPFRMGGRFDDTAAGEAFADDFGVGKA